MKNDLFPIVLLAGGLATRLRPLTETIPKSLVEIDGEPFLAHQLRRLHTAGIRQLVLCIGYLGEKVREFAGNGSDFGLDITYSFDGEPLLGTAGSIKKALPLLPDNFFVMYGDSYLTCSFEAIQAAFIHSHQPALMTVFHNQGQWDKSNIIYSNHQILRYDKKVQTPDMQYIDYGLGVFNQKAFAAIPPGEPYDLALLYQQLLADHALAAYEVKNRFYEVGSFTGIQELEDFLAQPPT